MTRGWIVCPALKLWPSFPWMCYSSELWVAHHHVNNQEHILFLSDSTREAIEIWLQSNWIGTLQIEEAYNTHPNPACKVCVGQGEGAGNPLWLWQKGSKLWPGRPKIVPTSKRDLEISLVKDTSGLDYVFSFMGRNVCGLWGLEQFRDFFFFCGKHRC